MTDLVHDTSALPDAFVGVAYSAAVAFHGAASGIIAADSLLTAVSDPAGNATLPDGLSINTTTNGTVISGTPTGDTGGPGVYTFTVKLQDTAGAVTSGDITLVLHSDSVQEAGGMTTEQADAGFTPAEQFARLWPSS